MADRLRAIILGAGAMARKHAEAYRAIDGVEVVAVGNRGETRGRELCADFGVPEFIGDYEEAIRSVDADLVSICVPTALHPILAIAAMEQGRHVVTEKPIALDIASAEKMAETSRRTGRKLAVVFNRRFNSVWEELGRRIESLGAPLTYNVQEIRSIRPKPAMHDTSLNGGPVIDCCVHDFDMVLQHFGKPVSVFATGGVYAEGKAGVAGIEKLAVDTAHITVRFENGHLGYFLYAWGFPAGSSYWQVREFMGPQGIVRLMGEFGGELRHYRQDGYLETVQNLVEDGHPRILEAFVDAIRTDGPVPVTAREGIAALELSLAALESIRTGKEITL